MSNNTNLQSFLDLVTDKNAKAQCEYGRTSFDRPLTEVVDEIQAEAIDLAGWAYFVWERCERMRQMIYGSQNNAE